MDGETRDEGRVEICLDGIWGSICDNSWNSRDAAVVCRQLKYDGPYYSVRGKLLNSPLYFMDFVGCIGREPMLINCTYRSSALNCGINRAAGVICTNTTRCTEGAIHLLRGDTTASGRVQYCYQGIWHSVCADNWQSNQEARVICTKLGFAIYLSFSPVLVNYGQGKAPVLPLDIHCTGDDSTLSRCAIANLDSDECKKK